jgi:hypothetical protein
MSRSCVSPNRRMDARLRGHDEYVPGEISHFLTWIRSPARLRRQGRSGRKGGARRRLFPSAASGAAFAAVTLVVGAGWIMLGKP